MGFIRHSILGIRDIFDHLGRVLIQHRVMFDDDEGVTCLLQDGHWLEGGESPANVQLGRPVPHLGFNCADDLHGSCFDEAMQGIEDL